MLLKFKCNDTSSKIVCKCAITFVNEETAICSFLVYKNLENNLLEDSNVEFFKQIKFGDLYNTIKNGMLHLKAVER